MKLYASMYLFSIQLRWIALNKYHRIELSFHFVNEWMNEWNISTFNLINNFDSRSQLGLFMICRNTLARKIRNLKYADYGPEKCECAWTAPEPVHHNSEMNAHNHILTWFISRGETRWLNWDYISLCIDRFK